MGERRLGDGASDRDRVGEHRLQVHRLPGGPGLGVEPDIDLLGEPETVIE